MTTTSTLTPFALCEDLFVRYPLAVTGLDGGDSTMTVRDSHGSAWDLRFSPGGSTAAGTAPCVTMSLWREEGGLQFGPLAGSVPPDVTEVLSAAVPAPRLGSLFGWVDRDRVACLIAPWEHPAVHGPQWSLLAYAGPGHESCPAYAGRPLGAAFWADLKAGKVIVLDGLLASLPGALLHVQDDTTALGTDCVVAPLTTLLADRGPVLQKGVYLDPAVLAARPRVQVPPLAELLATAGITSVAGWLTAGQ